MEKKKYSIWFYVVLIFIPFLMILLLELSLRVINYGDDYSTFVEIEEISPGDYFLNPDLPKKYFSGTTAIPSVIPDPFTKEKSENTIRIFVFGGSTTAGYPYPTNASFPRQIKRKLEMFYPKNKIEVVNLGVSAVNTYFIYDILPDVIQQKPDLIILYAGHNEFYGALGPASSENISATPGVVKTILYLREFKTYQLVYDFVKAISSIFSNGEDVTRGTLMKQMIKDQEVPLNSELYKDGLIQFRENISETISLCNDENIPVIVGELISNLKQKPLSRSNQKAIELFKDANEILQEGDTSRALVLFEEAKDKDQLRFRAPEDFNKILYEFEKSHKMKLVKIKEGFETNSSDKITGYDLMVDHLHPNLDGYKLMADLFYEAVDEILIVRFEKNEKVSEHAIDNYLSDNFPFTRYDSTLADIKIEILLNDFPFKDNNEFDLNGFELENYSDSLAMQSIKSGLGWAAAHLKLFDYFYEQNKFDQAARELFTLMEDRPFYKSALKYGVPKLIGANKAREAKHILVRNHNRNPDGFTSKQLGIINLDEGNIKLANNLLKEALNYSSQDAEIFFHLSRSYFAMDDIDQAIESLRNCLSISPNYPEAKKIYEHLQTLQNKN